MWLALEYFLNHKSGIIVGMWHSDCLLVFPFFSEVHYLWHLKCMKACLVYRKSSRGLGPGRLVCKLKSVLYFSNEYAVVI